MGAELKVVGGPFPGKSIRVPLGKLLIGRAEDCDLRLGGEFVSSHHCVLLLDIYTLRIRDLGSKNGTFVNGRRIGTRVMTLLNNDTISIGELNVLVDLKPTTAPTQPVDADAKPEAPETSLEATVSLNGDTLQIDIVQIESDRVIPPLPSTLSPVPTSVIPNVLPSSANGPPPS